MVRRPVRLVCVLVYLDIQVTVACCARAHIHGTEVLVSRAQVTELAAERHSVTPGRVLVGRHIQGYYVICVFKMPFGMVAHVICVKMAARLRVGRRAERREDVRALQVHTLGRRVVRQVARVTHVRLVRQVRFHALHENLVLYLGVYPISCLIGMGWENIFQEELIMVAHVQEEHTVLKV